MAAIYNFPKIYNWYLNKRLKWIEKYRITTFIDTIKKYVSDGDVILDVACGTGNNCILLANNFPNSLIIGMDPNKAAIKYGQQLIDEAQIKNVRFIQGDSTKFNSQSLDKKKVNVITCSLGLSVIEDWKEAISNAADIMNQGGIYVVLDLYFPKDSWRRNISHFWVNSLFNAYHDRPILDKLKERFKTLEVLTQQPIFLFVGQKN